MSFEDALKKLKMVLFDVDGVLTDGRLYLHEDGYELKSFNARDGLGMKMLMDNGIVCGIISGRDAKTVDIRMRELGITEVHQGISDKIAVYEQLKEKYGFDDKEIAFVGDDVPEIKIFKRVGVAFAVKNAHELARNYADYVTNNNGGMGAVREVCDLILKSRGKEPYVPKK
ncbi:MAG: HAD hydrolase family protein [Candidatus Mcinerneyibacterium aminivorans]|uniref:HAD hydrolase family protein n=1 Tax=Candidatus Mcinerneyibacterium aminivorans TaxID=2703815 RepID=A0A5D0MKC8_9BACT|nr:MAG: HAD hydrolase family protein [Candidatus Mcinerneyibacterium aminivorans]